MDEIVSLKLTDEQIARLDRVAQKAGQTREEMAATLLEIALRISEFPYIQFRDFGAGLEAFVSGTRLRVWWVVTLVRDYEGDIAKAAEHLNFSERKVTAVMNYAAAFPDEIEHAIADNQRRADELERRLSSVKEVDLDLSAHAPAP